MACGGTEARRARREAAAGPGRIDARRRKGTTTGVAARGRAAGRANLRRAYVVPSALRAGKGIRNA